MPDFSKAKAGDKVYDLYLGYGRIVEVLDNGIEVRYPVTLVKVGYDFYGKHLHVKDLPRALYWFKPDISDPPPKKKIKGWVNVYSSMMGNYTVGEVIYTTEEKAYRPDAIATVPIVFYVDE